MADSVQLTGFDDLAKKLRELAPAMRKRVLRNALAAGARLVRDDAKRNAPLLQNAAKAPYRTRGTVRNAIRVRTSKQARKAGDVGVFVNVKPAKSGARGAKSKTDPFYWRWLEFGSSKMAATPFLKPATDKLPQALKLFEAQIGKWFAKIEASKKVMP